MDSSGVGGGENSMLTQNNSDLDSLSNLLINSYEDDAAALDQYESELEQNLQDNLLIDKEQSIQRLFQSFQTSACNVAQMFKDKSSQSSAARDSNYPSLSATSSWESFQNAAGAITVLYKDSLEACRVHMELGIHLGQQRKLKDLISFVKKKKSKRSIRKDELVAFLIGKQYPSQNQMFGLFGHQAASSNPFNLSAASGHRHRQINNRNRATLCSSAQAGGGSQGNIQCQVGGVSGGGGGNGVGSGSAASNGGNPTNSMGVNGIGGVAVGGAHPSSNSAISQLSLINSGDNSNGSEVETNSDLATFREALIMHNRSRDTPLNRTHTASHFHHHQQHHHQPHHNHGHQCQSHNGNALNTNSSNLSNNNNCDDLDCFFCEQIATHIEHKRSSAQLNFDMESPTRKRSRFY